jgi:hypothetical protein
MYIRSSVPHAYAKHGAEPCRALVVTSAAPSGALRPE